LEGGKQASSRVPTFLIFFEIFVTVLKAMCVNGLVFLFKSGTYGYIILEHQLLYRTPVSDQLSGRGMG
jgi:hypothetical protein